VVHKVRSDKGQYRQDSITRYCPFNIELYKGEKADFGRVEVSSHVYEPLIGRSIENKVLWRRDEEGIDASNDVLHSTRTRLPKSQSGVQGSPTSRVVGRYLLSTLAKGRHLSYG
jgi:hypothetical protein